MNPKYSKDIVEEICNYIREGDSQKIAVKKAGIAEGTFYKWINLHDELKEAVKKAKEEFRATITGKLEASLWKKAIGYEVTETETEYVSDKDGKPRIKCQKTKVKHIAPDTGALVFALTNVAPEEWINRQKVDVASTNKTETTQRFRFEDLPDDLLCGIADKLQDKEQERIKADKDGAEDNQGGDR